MTRTLLTLIFLCAQSHSFAHENSDSTNRVTICGRLSPANKAPEIRLIENYQTAVPHLQKERSVKVISSADSFYVSIPATDSIMYFRFLNLPPFRTQNTYAVKKGDSVFNASHIRLQDIQFNYLLNTGTRFPLKNARLILYVRNIGILWKSTDYNIDPDFTLGNAIPDPLSVSMGINFNL